MTFEQKVLHRRRFSALIAVGYIVAVASVELVLGFFVLWVALPNLGDQVRGVVCALLGISTLWAFMSGWNANRVNKTSLDIWLRDADPAERDVIVAAIKNEKEKLLNLIDVTPQGGSL